MPVDRPTDPRNATYRDTKGLTTALSPEDTQALLTTVPQAYRSRINDALLAACRIVPRHHRPICSIMS
ncbi:MAG: hypothetical protein WA702_03825 [Bradyrhizobium sp.]|uniref:hypothetical protein n=1 Tax=Bradyrhizobium sp. TaxID=376 RepID=UPI003C7E79E7